MKISVALLRQFFTFFPSLKNFIYAFENQCCVVASAFFIFFFQKFQMCENQCCVVASDFFHFFCFFKNFIYAFENQCCVVASAFFIFFSQNLIMAELRCVKISVALLRQFLKKNFCFFQNLIGTFQDMCGIVA